MKTKTDRRHYRLARRLKRCAASYWIAALTGARPHRRVHA